MNSQLVLAFVVVALVSCLSADGSLSSCSFSPALKRAAQILAFELLPIDSKKKRCVCDVGV